MPGGFTRIIMTMLSKLDRKTVIWTSMQTGDESFNHLPGDQVELVKAAPLFDFGKISDAVVVGLLQ